LALHRGRETDQKEITMITENTMKNVEKLIATTSFQTFYRDYDWKNDQLTDGFREILHLEKSLTSAAKEQAIMKSHILEIARWGGLPNIGKIQCYNDPLILPLYEDNEISTAVKNDPTIAVRTIKQQTTGIGPTYISKVLRFSAPAQFGAIDSRLVRVFGLGDTQSGKLELLKLKAKQAAGGRWFIGPDNWPDEYGTWIAILNHITDVLNSSEISCPHPEQFVAAGLREKGIWLTADVEMALFSYASQTIYGKRQ